MIGGGFAGTLIAKKLQHTFKVTLVDTKDYFEYKPGILRITVEPNHEKKLRVPHASYLRKTKLIVGKVTRLAKTYALVNGKKIHFDYAVIASGATYRPFIKNPRVVIAADLENLRKNSEQIAQAEHVLVIGGGAVGVELAAELCGKKRVTLAHAANRLLERNHPDSSKYAQKYLERHGVTVIVDDKVSGYHNGAFITRKEARIAADLAFLCNGISLNADYLEDLLSTSLNDRKAVIVNEFLQAKDAPHIFAAGDMTNIAEEKTAQAAEKQAAVIAHNIVNLENKRRLTPYRSKKRVMVISLGKWKGILEYKKLVITGLLPGLVKKAVEIKGMIKRT